jgi:hypothetical protein
VTAIVTRGNAADLHLPDETVDLIVTSPPYFGLRSYQDGGEHYDGQIGDEATPAEYLDALIACTAEWMRVLKPGGSIFVNLGDKYKSNPGRDGRLDKAGVVSARTALARTNRAGGEDTAFKSLHGLPWRYAIRCIDELGLILRAEIVWAKPNGLPESVTDRVRRSHEQVFHFVKQPRYFSAVDEVRTPHVVSWTPGKNGGKARQSLGGTMAGLSDSAPNPLGALPGSVWEIPTAPLKVPDHLGVDHFAAYPPELVRRIVLGWSPREVCAVCGEGRRPVKTTEKYLHRPSGARYFDNPHGAEQVYGNNTSNIRSVHTVTGYACACPDTTAPTTPGVCLDPFGGTGTTALVASCHGRVGISVDLSADYCRLAQWRTADPGERARVLMVDKPPVQVDGQLSLIEGLL